MNALRIFDMHYSHSGSISLPELLPNDRWVVVGSHKLGNTGMIESFLISEQLLEVRAVLESVLQILDDAELHMPAIHVASAISELERKGAHWPRRILESEAK